MSNGAMPIEAPALAPRSHRIAIVFYYVAWCVVICYLGFSRVGMLEECKIDGRAETHLVVPAAETTDAGASDAGASGDAGSDGGAFGGPASGGPASGGAAPDGGASIGENKSAQSAATESAALQLVILALLAGALGGALHGMASVSFHVGNGRLTSSWWAYYVFLPFVGGATALVFYFVARAGVTGLKYSADTCYPVLAWASLAGLFSTVAMQKLRDVFVALFAPSQGGTPPQQVSAAAPASAPAPPPPPAQSVAPGSPMQGS